MTSDDRPSDGSRTKNDVFSQTDFELQIPKIVSFDEISRCGDEVWIENRGALYRLRRTRQGKLILTK